LDINPAGRAQERTSFHATPQHISVRQEPPRQAANAAQHFCGSKLRCCWDTFCRQVTDAWISTTAKKKEEVSHRLEKPDLTSSYV